MIGNNKLN